MARRTRAEALDRLLVFTRPVETGRTEANEPVVQWQEHLRAWGRQIVIRGSEPLQNGQVQGAARILFRVRWTEGVSVQDRVECDGVNYRVVVPPIEVGRREFLDIEVAARADGVTDGWI